MALGARCLQLSSLCFVYRDTMIYACICHDAVLIPVPNTQVHPSSIHVGLHASKDSTCHRALWQHMTASPNRLVTSCYVMLPPLYVQLGTNKLPADMETPLQSWKWRIRPLFRSDSFFGFLLQHHSFGCKRKVARQQLQISTYPPLGQIELVEAFKWLHKMRMTCCENDENVKNTHIVSGGWFCTKSVLLPAVRRRCCISSEYQDLWVAPKAQT